MADDLTPDIPAPDTISPRMQAEFLRQAQDDVFREVAPRLQELYNRGDEAGAEQLLAQSDRESRSRAVAAARTMLDFHAGRASGFGLTLALPFSRGTDTPTLAGTPSPGTGSRLPSGEDLARSFVPSAPEPTRDIIAGVPPAPTPSPTDRSVMTGRMTDALQGVELAPPSAPSVGFSTQSAGTAYHPIAEAMARYGVNGEGFTHSLALHAAPFVNTVEGASRALLGAAGEATGVPAAERAGVDLAKGDYMRGIGEGLMALPSRGAGLVGSLLASADAETPDPRVKQIADLNAEIARREATIRGYGNRSFTTAKARADAVKIETDGIAAARDTIKRLTDAMDAEKAQRDAAERARLASAEWARTPFGRKYPGAPEALAGAGALLSFAVPYGLTRRTVGQYNTEIQGLLARWQEAIDRANNNRLAPATRTTAAAEARAFQQQFEALTEGGPHTPGHLGGFGMGAPFTEMGLAAPTVADYIGSQSDPSGQLHDYTMQQIDLTTPTPWSRYGLGLGVGGGLGTIGEMLGARDVDRPVGYAAETEALKRRYTRRSR